MSAAKIFAIFPAALHATLAHRPIVAAAHESPRTTELYDRSRFCLRMLRFCAELVSRYFATARV
jgi:hypothetical protein